MRYGLTVSSAPSVEPVTVAQAKAFARVEHGEEEDDWERWITAARVEAETYTQRSLVNTTWSMKFDTFPDDSEIKIPRAPLVSVTSVKYLAAATGTETTIDSGDYSVLTSQEPGLIVPAYGEVWPTPRDFWEAVRVVFIAGYGSTAASVPAGLREWICRVCAYWNENRDMGEKLPEAFYLMLAPYCWGELP
jgi:uncharacterized phiE125 gp8 family phage protein